MEFRLLLDASVPKALATALRRRVPATNGRRVQEIGLRNAPDEEILRFAAKDRRIVVSRDKATLRVLAAERVRLDQPMPGLFVVRGRFAVAGAGIGALVDDLELIAGATDQSEWEGLIQFLPFLWS